MSEKQQRQSAIIAIEGNIGAGKSTFLDIIKGKIQTDYILMPEPVEEWQNVGGQNVNLLDLSYKDPARWGYTFQSYAFFTRIRNWTQLKKQIQQPLCFQERSVLSDKHIFCQNSYENKLIGEGEWHVYNEWFQFLNQELGCGLNGIIYLQTSPETCLSRCQKRDRLEESTMDLNYLQQIHLRHEEWLVKNQKDINLPVLIINTDKEFETDMQQQSDIVDKVKNFIRILNIQI